MAWLVNGNHLNLNTVHNIHTPKCLCLTAWLAALNRHLFSLKRYVRVYMMCTAQHIHHYTITLSQYLTQYTRVCLNLDRKLLCIWLI